MEHSVATIQCQNLTCLAPNSLSNQFCEKCGTPLVKRYLRMMGDWVKTYYRIGELVEDRYLVKAPQVVLDTKPVLAPQVPDEFPTYILPYLKLFSHRWQVPQVYGYIPTPDEQLDMNIWLLEYGTVPTDASGELQEIDLLPQLTDLWSEARPIRQLYWLWQIANLWHPFQGLRVTSSLLNPSLLRVNGSLVQLLELEMERDENPRPELKQLGNLWAEWIPQASPQLKNFLEALCQNLSAGQVNRSDHLLAILDQALQHYADSQQRTYHLFTCTDTGTLREHNEDACYPASGALSTSTEQQTTSAIVCDGIGGQEGGEIASHLAIETLQTDVAHLLDNQSNWNSNYLMQTLNQAICKANDVISQRNDKENRQERRRMGTTLVMALAHQHQMYIGHVGDSRVYQITPQGCHQITVDDDLASREVRLGYLLYRDAIQYPNAGALVQALGMSSAASLHPTVQRYLLDEDCIFLLCSDGLSDYDRVEQYWTSEILPIFQGEKTVIEVGQRLIEIANQKNGHDNSTIALFYCQVQPTTEPLPPLSYSEIEAISNHESEELAVLETFENYQEAEEASAAELPTEPSFSVSPRVTSPTPRSVPIDTPTMTGRPRSSLPLLLGVSSLLIFGIAGFHAYRTFVTSVESVPSPSNPSVIPLSDLTKGKVLKTNSEIKLEVNAAKTAENVQVTSSITLPPKSVLKVIAQPSATNRVELEVCSPLDFQSLQGHLVAEQLQDVIVNPTPEEQRQCPSVTPNSPTAPVPSK